MANEIFVYTDGSCLGNPGPGGWAAVLTWRQSRKEISGGEASTTNNRMELTAVIRALQAIKSGDGRRRIHIFTDSQYVQRGMEQWLQKWRVNGYKTASKKPVKNSALWQELDTLCQQHAPQFFWVRGHDGNAKNEEADALARAAATRAAAGDGQ